MVLLASPNAGVRRRWRQALQRVSGIHQAATRAALERHLAALKPATLLLDLAVPKLGGIDGVRALRRLSPSTKIILLTKAPREQEGISALKAGASGYCETDLNAALLRKAVEMVQKGEIWVRRSMIPHLLEELALLTHRRNRESPAHRDRRLDRLTPRQREVVRLIGGGASNKEIASQLNVTERTVKAHLTAIFRKIGVSDRLRLALFVTEQKSATR